MRDSLATLAHRYVRSDLPGPYSKLLKGEEIRPGSSWWGNPTTVDA
jgi:hypothetical protein